MKIAYGRVSAKDQNPERQIIKFLELGVDERYIFIDKQSGRDFDRPKYQAMRLMIREGDLLHLDALDRLGRSYDGIINEWKYITREINADIICLDNEALFDSRKFKTMGDFGKVMEDQFLSLLAYVAEQERLKNHRVQSEGIIVARANGVKFGRPRKEIDEAFLEAFHEWKNGKITAIAAMKKAGITKSSFYRRVKELKKFPD